MSPKVITEIPREGAPLPQIRKNGARLLSLDGGGVKGVSSLIILDAIMERVKKIEIARGINTSDAPRKPADYFDLAGGTSTGGLIGLMLFRLKMDTKQCITEYNSLASQIFAPTLFGNQFLGSILGKVGLGKVGLMANAFIDGAQFSGKPLEKAIMQVVNKYSDPGDRWKDYLVNPNSKMMFMCSTLKDKGESILLRSYLRPSDATPISSLLSDDDLVNGIKIVPAARATSAAPVYLPEEDWPVRNGVIRFWDGGVLNNNPVEQVYNSRFDLVGVHDAPPAVSCVLSLGCGWTQNSKPSFLIRVLNTVSRFSESFLANTEAKHRDFQRLVQRMNDRKEANVSYFRFNCPCGDTKFDMADYTIMPKLADLTRRYIQTDPDAARDIDRCAELLASRA